MWESCAGMSVGGCIMEEEGEPSPVCFLLPNSKLGHLEMGSHVKTSGPEIQDPLRVWAASEGPGIAAPSGRSMCPMFHLPVQQCGQAEDPQQTAPENTESCSGLVHQFNQRFPRVPDTLEGELDGITKHHLLQNT